MVRSFTALQAVCRSMCLTSEIMFFLLAVCFFFVDLFVIVLSRLCPLCVVCAFTNHVLWCHCIAALGMGAPTEFS